MKKMRGKEEGDTPLQNKFLLGYGAPFSIGALSFYYHFLDTISVLSPFTSAHLHS